MSFGWDGRSVDRFGFVAAVMFLAAAAGAAQAHAQAAPFSTPPPDPRTLDQRLQDLKGEILLLNRDLSNLRDELLNPGDAAVTFYLALDVSGDFALDSVTILMDNRIIAADLYEPRQVSALRRGGIRRLFKGIVRSGSHRLEARVTGTRAGGASLRRSATFIFEKGRSPRDALITITDSGGKGEPSLLIDSRDE